jgi:galactokinase
VDQLDNLRSDFRHRYSAEPALFRAPGRVNLIGGHLDYNDGFVLPIAIQLGTIAAASPRPDRFVRVHSVNTGESATFDLDQKPDIPEWVPYAGWPRYVEGVARVLQQGGIPLGGVNLSVYSDVPLGAGLSSSAALEIATALAFLWAAGRELQPIDLARAAQQAEHRFAGVQCGIMDQLTCVLGRPGCALLIDCRSLDTAYIPLDSSRVAIMVCDTHVKHELASSEYNTRRAECNRAVELLSSALPGIQSLRDVSWDDFQRVQHLLPEPIHRRCRHVVTEMTRVLAAVDALRQGNLEETGRLMSLSHASLRDDYEVSSMEQNLLVEIAASLGGVYGSRMTGGGFGGCTVALLRPDTIDRFREEVVARYSSIIGSAPSVYSVVASSGAARLQ